LPSTNRFASATLEQAVREVAASLEASDLFYGHGAVDAEQEASWLVLSAMDWPLEEEPDWLKIVDPDQGAAIERLLDQRITSRKPLAYLLGEAWFAGFPFTVDERVLVPRSFIGEWIPDRFSPWVDPDRIHRVLDLCCGSGCIGLATALVLPDAEVVLSDLSSEALEVAALNIARHGLGERVTTVLGNGLENVSAGFDLVLCNPPYVSDDRMQSLPAEYRHEPGIGLAAGVEGLDFIAPLLSQVAGYLNPGGSLLLEAGSAGAAVQRAWPTVPFTWLGTEFDEMVLCMLTREELQAHQTALDNPLLTISQF